MRSTVRSALRSRGVGDATIIRLGHDLVFESDLDLPLAADRSLHQILYHQLDRLTPLDPNLIRFAHHVTSRSQSSKTMRVHVMVAKATTIDGAVKLAMDLGLRPEAVTADGGDEERPYDAAVLWRAREGGQIAVRRGRWLRGLELAIAVVLLMTGGLWIHKTNNQIVSLQKDVTDARRAAISTQGLVAQSNQMKAALTAVEGRRSALSPLKIIDELTRLVPNDSWVFQLAIRGGAIEMAGYAPRATDLIARIQGSPLFKAPKFRSPITVSPDGNKDRFDLDFETKQASR
jgi:general secretion pathway protein L